MKKQNQPLSISTSTSTFFLALFSLFTLHSLAAVPLKWTVETSRLQPVAFDAVRGETLALEASFKSYGTDVSTSNLTASLYWQTNGMDSAWWVTNAVTSGSSASVLFTPAMDPGAPAIHAFLALTDTNTTLSSTHYPLSSLSYRAAFTLRFRRGPGATPNVIDAPVPILDLANTVVINPPWPTTNDFIQATNRMEATLKDYVDSEIEGAGLVTPTAVTNAASTTVSNLVTKTFVEALGISGGGGISAAAVTNIAESAAITNAGAVAYADAAFLKKKWNGYYGDEGTFSFHWDFIGNSIQGLTLNHTGNYYAGINPNYLVVNDWNRICTTDGTSSDLPSYLASTAWHGSDKSLADYGITNSIPADNSSQLSQLSQSQTQLASQVATIGGHLNAEDARFVSTNYNSSTHMPEAYVEVKQTDSATGSNVWLNVWSEMTRWNKFVGDGFDWDSWTGFLGWKTNLENSVAAKSPREYAFYDGVTGNVAPDDCFWISQPRIAVCAGAAYQKYVESGAAVWLLESNGLITDINGTTNGYFRITDEEGNSQFEVVKGDKTTVFAACGSMVCTNVVGVDHWYCQYAVTNAVAAPTAKFCRNLTNLVWYADSDSGCPCNVSWTLGQNSTYTLEFWAKSSEPSMFVKAEYERGGETYINNTAPVKMQTIMIGNKKYSLGTTTVNGETVLKLTEVN